MARIIFILGGARSGKSKYAAGLAQKSGRRVAFIATAEPNDPEMKSRIKLHKKARPKHWTTLEEPKDLTALLSKIGKKFKCVIIDCLTLLVSNLFLEGLTHKSIEKKLAALVKGLKNAQGKVFIVSNEVGLGIVPENKLARGFRDIAGKINQLVAEEADEVYFMISGIPWKIK